LKLLKNLKIKLSNYKKTTRINTLILKNLYTHILNKLAIIIKYFRYFFKARFYKGHGIHSPFIYKFVREVVYQDSKKNDYKIIESYRNLLLKNYNLIKIDDYGAGSKTINSEYRKVKQIAKYSSTKKKYGKLLYRIVNFYKPNNIIELGTSLGIGTLYLALGNKKSKIYSIEGSKEIYKITTKNINRFNIKNIELLNNKFEIELLKILNEIDTVDLVFFDGNHHKNATINYFNLCIKKINNNSIFIFDDIHWSKGMEEAWNTICLHSKTKVCIDLFQFGIVFFKQELSKENYILRY